MPFLLFGGFYFGKIWKILGKRPFFRADTAGLGKYCTGGYGRIGVYRGEARPLVRATQRGMMNKPNDI